MKGLVLEEDGKLAYRDLESGGGPSRTVHDKKTGIGLPDGVFRPTPFCGKPYLVKVAAAGVCGSDIPRAFSGGSYLYPLVLGHEFSGTVVEAPHDGAISAGTGVAVFPLLPCGRCESCATGDYALCADYDYFGSRRDGGFREYVTVPEFNLLPVPDDVPLLHAAMTEPCAVALHGVRRMRIEPGMSGAVIGGGPIGNMAAQWLRIAGCDPVFVVDIDREKLEIARQMGFVTVDGSSTNPVEAITDATAGRGADCVIEACGLPKTAAQSLDVAAKFGQVVLMGNLHGTLSIHESAYTTILRRELKVFGTWNSKYVPPGSSDWHVVLNHLGKDLRVEPLISHTPTLPEGPEILRKMSGKDTSQTHGSAGGRRKSFNKVIFRVS
jgi:L-iditol 2-dehydrogenase